MFVTPASYEIPLLPSLASGRMRLWTVVEMGLEVPWFHATFRFHDGEEDRVRTLLTASCDELRAPRDDERWHTIVEVQLVSPGWLNGTDTWRMDPLNELRIGDTELGQVYLFLLADGRCLTDPGVDFHQVANQETLFALKRHT